MIILTVSILILILGLILSYRYYFGQRFIRIKPFEGQVLSSSVKIGEMTRSFLYYIPSNIREETSILFILHGAQDTGKVFRKRTGYEFDRIAEKEKFIAIYPNGYKKSWNDCRLNARYPAKKKNTNDIQLLNEIKTEISRIHNIRVKSVFVFGYSNGGQLLNKICLESPGFINAAAIVAANLPVKENLDCIEKRISAPLVFLCGTADKTNPFEGGLVKVLNIKKLGCVRSAQETIDYWTELAGCNDPLIEFTNRENKIDTAINIEKRTWKKGNVNYIVQYIIHGGGHTIPLKNINFPRILGATAHDINFPEEVWSFFKQLN